MGKQNWKPGNMLNPVPAVMVSVADKAGNANIITVAWAGTVCTNPPMVSISVRPERFSYDMLEETKEFVINLTTEALVKACDYCGVTSGRDVDKFEKMNLPAYYTKAFPKVYIKDAKTEEEQLLKTSGFAYVEKLIDSYLKRKSKR